MAADLPANSRQLHGILKRFAIDVDPARLERTLPRVRKIVKAQHARPGESIKVLLQELDRPIDPRLAAEIEYALQE